MNAKSLSSIPETMLITLWAKAVETERPDGLLKDEIAAKIIQSIDYDFSSFRKARMSQVGCCIRARLIDEEALRFLALHPDAVVVQLGAGLDARYQRLGCPAVTHWYDLDLPEAIALRREYIPETERNTYLALSMLDAQWMEQVKAHGKPTLLIIEGVIMYFEPAVVRDFFLRLCEEFAEATVLMDILAYGMLHKAKHHDALSKTTQKAEFLWSVPQTREMEAWHPKLHLAKEYFMSQHDHRRFPWLFRMLYKIPAFSRRFDQRIVRLEIRPTPTSDN